MFNCIFIIVFIYCYDNPKGYLPSWFINWVAKVSKTEPAEWAHVIAVHYLKYTLMS